MPRFVKVARVAEIPPGSGRAVKVEGVDLAVWNLGGVFHATSNVCVHRGGPLADGELSGSVIQCPWHSWEFDVTDGRCRTNPQAAIPAYEVKVEGDEVLVAL